MLAAAIRAFSDVFSPPLRRILLKSIGIALLLFVVLGVLVQTLIAQLVELPQYFEGALLVATTLGYIAGAIYLMPPISSLIAALFVDQVAEVVERDAYPADPVGKPLSLATASWLSLKFFGLVLAVNFLALLLLLLPIINVAAFFLANAYLLSREYFQLAALRHRSLTEAQALRRAHAPRIFIAGLIIAGVVAIPVLNLITPVFATAFMVHLHRGLNRA